MKYIFSLLLVFLLIVMPTTSFTTEERDFSKYTVIYVEETTKKLAAEIYAYIYTIDENSRKFTYSNKVEIELSIIEIINKYEDNKDLIVNGRLVSAYTLDKKVPILKIILIELYLVSDIQTVQVTLILDIDEVKSKTPIDFKSNVEKS